jgi:murein DD-endopeptidase MepM/ murein hydrolase activator NlpD
MFELLGSNRRATEVIMRRRALPIWLSIVAIVLGISPPVEAAPCWHAPVSGVVTDPFRAPPCPYCSGNRGIEYAVERTATVRAVASGTVTWSGSVAGTRYVIVRHANGWRTTYGQLDSTSLSSGDRVLTRTVIGTATRVFYFGLRIGDVYTDPQPFLGRVVGRPRLVPVDGSRARPTPPPRLRCQGH